MFPVLIFFAIGFAGAVFDAEIHLKYSTLPRDEFIKYFNNLNLSWTITHYEELENINLMGTKKRNPQKMLPVKLYNRNHSKDLPDNFDAREHWPDCETIKEIYNQGYCGSCWTFGGASTASDRTCIHSNISVRLSELDVQCSQPDESICHGGNAEDVFKFWIYNGLVTQTCKPYDVNEAMKPECKTECHDRSIDYEKDKHFGAELYAIDVDDEAIRYELATNGPVQAGFDIYEDFRHYKDGIYEHTYGKLVSAHSIRMIGYGIENGIKYWLAANSWGPTFGEKGFFRIKRFQGLGFEDDLVTGLPKK